MHATAGFMPWSDDWPLFTTLFFALALLGFFFLNFGIVLFYGRRVNFSGFGRLGFRTATAMAKGYQKHYYKKSQDRLPSEHRVASSSLATFHTHHENQNENEFRNEKSL